MNNYEGNPRDRLVHLEMIDIFNIEPPPDKSVQGRLARMLKSVGSKGKLAVRARMITSVSNTKFRTLDGEPISLVGLHGKDEVLALGPAWAIERLGEGLTPDEELSSLKEYLEMYRKLAELILAEKPFSAGLRKGPGIRIQGDPLSSARYEIKRFDEAGLAAALTFVESVIEKLEAYITELEAGQRSWWFLWTAQSREELKDMGLPDLCENDADLLQYFSIHKQSIDKQYATDTQ